MRLSCRHLLESSQVKSHRSVHHLIGFDSRLVHGSGHWLRPVAFEGPRVLCGFDTGVELDNEGSSVNCVFYKVFVWSVEQYTRHDFFQRRLSCRQLCVCRIVLFHLSVAWFPELPMAGVFGMRPPPRGGGVYTQVTKRSQCCVAQVARWRRSNR